VFRIRWANLKRSQVLRRKTRTRLPEITVRNLRAIMAASESAGGPYGATDRALILTAATTRLRDGELLALHWGGHRLNRGNDHDPAQSVRAEFGLPKTGRIRRVRLAPRARQQLRHHRASLASRAPEDLVFPDPSGGGCLDPAAVRRRFRAALRLAGLPAMHLFHLRWGFRPPWWSRYL
jgi:integrase